MVALGNETAGAFTNDEDGLLSQLQKASKRSFEAIWHMPITSEHRTAIKCPYGDISNLGNAGRFGGASTAAAFLECFVEKDVKWCHLDIAGPAMAKAAKPPICADQTGFGASLLLHFLS